MTAPTTSLITGLNNDQLDAYENKAEAAVRSALNHVLGVVADHIGKTHTPSALVAADPGEPYVSPDDLAAITPLWQQQMDETLLPLVGQVYQDSAGTLHSSLIDATGLSELPSVTPLAAQAQLQAAQNSFEQVGAQAWETARSELLDGFAAGESIPQLATRLRDSANMTATRATLVARTQVLAASNAGSYDTAVASGLDLLKGWEATPDLRTRETHLAAWSRYSGPDMIPLNEPFMVGGWPALHPHDPELPPEERYNCFPIGTAVQVPNLEIGYRRLYTGPLVEVALASGHKLAATPNHPVLTDVGWRPVRELHEGDHLVRCTLSQEMTLCDPNIDHIPAVVEQVFATLTKPVPAKRVAGSDLDFHGDGSDGEIEVVRTNRHLRQSYNAALGQPTFELVLPTADELERTVTCPSMPLELLFGDGLRPSCNVGRGGQASSLLQASRGHPDEHGVSTSAWLDTGLDQPPADNGSADLEVQGQSLLGFASEITLDKVIDINVTTYVGHVFNFQTEQGWYIANGIISRNCRCTTVYQVREPGQIERMRLEQEAQRARIEEQLAEQRRVREAIIEEQRQRLAATLEEQRRQLEHSFEEIRRGRTVAKAIPDTGPSVAAQSGRVTEIAIRPSLQAADTVAEVRRAFLAEWAALIRPQGLVGPNARFLAAADVQTVREEAEALLRAIERFPRAPLAVSHGPNPHYAQTEDLHVIVFSNAYAKDRDAFLQSLLSGGLRNEQGYVWHPMSTASPGGVAMHEFGHVIHHALSPLEPITLGELTAFRYSTRIDDIAEKIARDLAAERGITVDELIRTEIGVYAAEGQAGAAVRTPELIAESFADAMINGDAASVLSKRIFVMLVDEYDKALPSRVIGPPATIFPKAAPGMTPAQFEQRIAAAARGQEAVRTATPLDYENAAAFNAAVGAELRQAVGQYRGIAFRIIQDNLRLDEADAASNPVVQKIDQALAASVLRRDVVVYRGALARDVLGDQANRSDLTGFVFREAGYTSTASDQAIGRLAANRTGELGLYMRLYVPRGIQGITLSEGEAELMLQRGLSFRVVADRGVEQFGRFQHRLLDVEVMPSRIVSPSGVALPKATPRTTPAEFDTRVHAAASDRAALRVTLVTPDNPQIAESIMNYGLSEATRLNGALRAAAGQDLGSDVSFFLRRMAADLDAAMRPTRRDLMVWRAVSTPEKMFGDRPLIPGLTWTDFGFASTDARAAQAFLFAPGETMFAPARAGVRMRILVPKGTRAISVDQRLRRGTPGALDPDEIVLDRGLTYRLIRDNGLDEQGIRNLDVEVISSAAQPATPADFAPLGRAIGEALVQLDAGTDLSSVVALFEGDPVLRKALLAARRATDRDKLAASLRRLADREGIAIPTPAQLRAIKTAERRATAQTKREAAAAARAEKAKAAAVKAQVKEIESGQFQHLDHVAGDVFQGPDGTRWVVTEFRTEKAAREQALAAALRDLTRADRTVPDLTIVVGRQASGLRGWQVAYRGVSADPGPADLDGWLTAGLDRLNAVTPAKIRALVARYGLDSDLADKLIAQRAQQILRAKAATLTPARVRTMHRLNDRTSGMKTRVISIDRENIYEDSYEQFTGWRQVNIEITSGTGAAADDVGYATVLLSPDGRTVYYGALAIDAPVQGQGFVTRLMMTMFERYRAAGVKVLGIRANADVGGYAWARAGFRFFDADARQEFAAYARAYARGESVSWYQPGSVSAGSRRVKLDPEMVRAFLRVADDPTAEPIDYAMIGYVGGSKMWPGKEFMLGSTWQGRMDLS